MINRLDTSAEGICSAKVMRGIIRENFIIADVWKLRHF
jgi:hypothetical protein